MPLTQEQIDRAFTDQWKSYREAVIADPNYTSICDYLTGKTSTLQNLVPTHSSGICYTLPSLIESVEAPTENDKLLLNVLFHPQWVQINHYPVFNWLMTYLAHNDKEETVQAVVSLLGRLGMSPAQIVGYALLQLQHFIRGKEVGMEQDSPIRKFLAQHFPATIPAVQTHYGWSYSSNGNWSQLYFSLAQEVQPDLAVEYLHQVLENDAPGMISWLAKREDVQYLSLVKQWALSPLRHLQELPGRMKAAIAFYQMNPNEATGVTAEVALSYLRAYDREIFKQRWEDHERLADLKEIQHGYIRLSALALHFLLATRREQALKLLEEWLSKGVTVNADMFKVLQHHLADASLPYLQQGLQTTGAAGGNKYYQDLLDLLIQKFTSAAYTPVLWSLVSTKSRLLRENIAKLLVQHDEEAMKKAIALLAHKSPDARQTGALILSAFNSTEAVQAVNDLLDRETNDNARDIYLNILKENLPRKADAQFLQHMIAAAEQRKKLSKPVASWLDESLMPPLYNLSGEALPAAAVRFLFYRMSRTSGMRSDTEANFLIQTIDKERSIEFARHILQVFLDNGGKTEHKWLLTLAALTGTEDIVDRFRSFINRCIEEGRLKMAEFGVGALALQGSDKALRWVEWYSRKYKVKKKNVGAAALQALETAADELSITIHELGDRVVPDFGFEDLYKTFSIGSEEYRAFIDSRFKLCFFNEEGKQLKALPAATPPELKEEFKEIGKEVRDVVRSQSGRMEYYLLIQRRWKTEAWKGFFLTNPVMFIYATKIVWGMYNEAGGLKDCFVCLEDSSLVNAEDDEIDLDEQSFIGIVHPLDLTSDQLEAWKRKIFDLSIAPVFPQLERMVYKVQQEEAGEKIVRAFEGKQSVPNGIKPVLEKFGWRSGGAMDGGYIDAFQLADTTNGIIAVLEVQGVFVGFGFDDSPTLGALYFIDPAKQPGKWITSPKNNEDERLIALNQLPPVFYSEVMYNIHSIRLAESREAATAPI